MAGKSFPQPSEDLGSPICFWARRNKQGGNELNRKMAQMGVVVLGCMSVPVYLASGARGESLLSSPASGNSGIPLSVNFQGRLLGVSSPATIRFEVIKDTGLATEQLLYREKDQTISLDPATGVFSYAVGTNPNDSFDPLDAEDFPKEAKRFSLRITVNPGQADQAVFEEPIRSVPFAFRADEAEKSRKADVAGALKEGVIVSSSQFSFLAQRALEAPLVATTTVLQVQNIEVTNIQATSITVQSLAGSNLAVSSQAAVRGGITVGDGTIQIGPTAAGAPNTIIFTSPPGPGAGTIRTQTGAAAIDIPMNIFAGDTGDLNLNTDASANGSVNIGNATTPGVFLNTNTVIAGNLIAGTTRVNFSSTTVGGNLLVEGSATVRGVLSADELVVPAGAVTNVVITNPSAPGANVIQPTVAGIPPLTLRRLAGSATNLLQVQDENGNNLVAVSSTSEIVLRGLPVPAGTTDLAPRASGRIFYQRRPQGDHFLRFQAGNTNALLFEFDTPAGVDSALSIDHNRQWITSDVQVNPTNWGMGLGVRPETARLEVSRRAGEFFAIRSRGQIMADARSAGTGVLGRDAIRMEGSDDNNFVLFTSNKFNYGFWTFVTNFFGDITARALRAQFLVILSPGALLGSLDPVSDPASWEGSPVVIGEDSRFHLSESLQDPTVAGIVVVAPQETGESSANPNPSPNPNPGEVNISTPPVQMASVNPADFPGSHGLEKMDFSWSLAVSGIVQVRACDEAGPIRPGDRLITSSRKGYACKAPEEFNGPGLIGKALEPLNGGTGKIRTLLTLR